VLHSRTSTSSSTPVCQLERCLVYDRMQRP
jgi:hypothetical protein